MAGDTDDAEPDCSEIASLDDGAWAGDLGFRPSWEPQTLSDYRASQAPHDQLIMGVLDRSCLTVDERNAFAAHLKGPAGKAKGKRGPKFQDDSAEISELIRRVVNGEKHEVVKRELAERIYNQGRAISTDAAKKRLERHAPTITPNRMGS